MENVTDNMVHKTIIEYHQRNKSYTVPDFTDDTVLAEKTQDTDEDATKTPSHNNENLIEEMQLQDERYEVTDKDITETCDIATKFKLFEEFQVSVEKKLLTRGCYSISGNSSISVINILKDRISILENELSTKASIIDCLSNKLITSKCSKSQDSINNSRRANI